MIKNSSIDQDRILGKKPIKKDFEKSASQFDV